MARKSTPLISSRYAAMYVPNTEWVFLDAISKSDQCKVAFANGELSTQGKNVKKYLEITAEDRLRQYRESQRSTTPQPPQHIIELLKLQSSRGKFENLADVLTCLFMPQTVQFRHDHMFAEWEKATAFAIAAMRQQNQYFDFLCDFHDKAFAMMDSNEILFEARELLNAYQFTEVEVQDTQNYSHGEGLHDTASRNQGDTPQQQQGRGDTFGTEISETWAEGSLDASQRSSLLQQAPMLSTAQLAQAFHGLGTIQEQLGEDMSTVTAAAAVEEDEDGEMNLDELVATEDRREGEGDNSSSGQASPSFSALQERLVQLSVNRDETKIAAQQDVVNRLQLEVISQCIGIEKLVLEVHVVTERCVQAYCAAETRSHRCKQFDELTCMLGEGREASAGFPDWRGRGVRGVRPVMLQFFLTVQRLAEERLSLAELEQPGARRLDEKIRPEANLGRWKLLWNGHDVVQKVLHCLDFLRKCRELSEWYGPSFYFVANPLMLPFPLHPFLEQRALDVEVQVRDQQQTVPHLRLGTLRPGAKQEWEHQKHLNQWRRQFQTLAECWAFNWPTVPDTKEDAANALLYEALLVVCTTCQSTLKRSYIWEKKFISQIHSVRGQDKHLIGHNTAKVDKKLDIPPDIARKPRLGQNEPLDIRRRSTAVGSQLQQQYSSNRRASEASSFAPYGYSLASSSQSQSVGLSDFSQEGGDDDSQEGVLRPNLAKVMQFTTMVKTAEEKAALKAKQQLAAMRKASVLNRGTTLQSPSRRGTHLAGRKTRSPSIAAQLGGAASGLPGTRRTASSRPSISAGSASPPGKLSAIHSGSMRKSSSASAAGMGLAPGLRRPSAAVDTSSSSRKHSTTLNSLPSSSSAKVSSSGMLGLSPGLLRKSSSASVGMGSHTGKFTSPSRAPSAAHLFPAGTIQEESSVDGLEEAVERPKEGKKVKLSTVLPLAPLEQRRSDALRKGSTASTVKYSPGATSPGGGGKSQRLSAPHSSSSALAEGSQSSADSHPRANNKSMPKNSTLSEGSIDNTSKSLALASPVQSPASKKSVHHKTLSRTVSTAPAPIEETAVAAAAGGTTTVEERAASPKKGRKKSKRGSVLKIDAEAAPSSAVTRLPPVQGQLRLTRRRGEGAAEST